MIHIIFVLHQNPVHSTAHIYFQLNDTRNVKIELVDMNGKLRGIVYNGTRQAGYQYIYLIISPILPTRNLYVEIYCKWRSKCGSDFEIVK